MELLEVENIAQQIEIHLHDLLPKCGIKVSIGGSYALKYHDFLKREPGPNIDFVLSLPPSTDTNIADIMSCLSVFGQPLMEHNKLGVCISFDGYHFNKPQIFIKCWCRKIVSQSKSEQSSLYISPMSILLQKKYLDRLQDRVDLFSVISTIS